MPSAREDDTTLRTTASVRIALVLRYLLSFASDRIYTILRQPGLSTGFRVPFHSVQRYRHAHSPVPSLYFSISIPEIAAFRRLRQPTEVGKRDAG